MIQSFLELLKVFFEKGFIKTLCAIVIAGVIYYFTPEDCSVIIKFTNIGYFVFVLVCSYLFVELLCKIFKLLSKIGRRISDAFRYAINQERKAKELWSNLEKANDDEYEMVINLLKTDNEPISSMFGMRFTHFIEDWFEHNIEYGTHHNYYFLKEEIYRLLKSSMNSYIKSSGKEKPKEGVR